LVELIGASSTKERNVPKGVEKVFRVNKNADPFVFRGKINGKYCDFKLDTGSDVTVINPKLIDVSGKHIPVKNERLRYPTGEKVPVKFRSQVKVELGKYSCRMLVYVAEIGENCILGADFCLQTGIDKVFRSAILESSQGKKSEHLFCAGFLLFRREFQISVGNFSNEILRKRMSHKRGFLRIFLRNFRIYFLNRS